MFSSWWMFVGERNLQSGWRLASGHAHSANGSNHGQDLAKEWLGLEDGNVCLRAHRSSAGFCWTSDGRWDSSSYPSWARIDGLVQRSPHCRLVGQTQSIATRVWAGRTQLYRFVCRLQRRHVCLWCLRPTQWQHYGQIHRPPVPYRLWVTFTNSTTSMSVYLFKKFPCNEQKIPRWCSNVWQFQARQDTVRSHFRYGVRHQRWRQTVAQVSALCRPLLPSKFLFTLNLNQLTP